MIFKLWGDFEDCILSCNAIVEINFYLRSKVFGIDASFSAIELAKERSKKLSIDFNKADMMTIEFKPNTFDVVYSRDVFVFVSQTEKTKLLQKIYTWLKPNGKLLLIDFISMKTPSLQSNEFKSFVRKRGYSMSTINDYSG